MSQAEESPPSRLDQTIILEAVSKLTLKPLATHLAQIGLDVEVAVELLGMVRRANGLVLRQHDPKKAARRDAFLAGLADTLRETFGAEVDDVMIPLIAHIKTAESGYHRIRASLAGSAFATLSLGRRCAAVIARTAVQVDDVLGKARELQAVAGFARSGSVLRDDQGRPINADGVVQDLVDDLGGALMMEAYENGLFAADGKIVLPELPAATDDDIYKAGLSEIGARYWSFWAGMEESSRALGGELEALDPGSLPKETPPDALLVYRHTRPLEPWPVFASRCRLADRANQNFVKLLLTTNVRSLSAGIEKQIPLSPGFVSPAEAHGLLVLSEYLARPVNGDHRLVEGLRFVEWVRGYAALSVLAETAGKPEGAWCKSTRRRNWSRRCDE